MSKGSLRVLMVDDNPLDRELVGELLAGRADVRFRWAEDLEQGLCAAQDGVDVLLLDHNLPDGHGSDRVGAFLRRAPGAAVIGLCSHGADDVRTAFLDAGAHAALLKGDLLVPDLPEYLQGLRRPEGVP